MAVIQFDQRSMGDLQASKADLQASKVSAAGPEFRNQVWLTVRCLNLRR